MRELREIDFPLKQFDDRFHCLTLVETLCCFPLRGAKTL